MGNIFLIFRYDINLRNYSTICKSYKYYTISLFKHNSQLSLALKKLISANVALKQESNKEFH